MINRTAAKKVKDRIGYSSSVGVANMQGGQAVVFILAGDRVQFDLVSFSSHHICGDAKRRFDMTFCWCIWVGALGVFGE